MKMYIPSVGDEVRLLADWTFQLYNEHRNETLMELISDTRKPEYYKVLTTVPCTIPAGSVLKVDRIYIRKGMEKYDSITFLWKGEKTESKMVNGWDWRSEKSKSIKKPGRAVRFWAKLHDVNGMEFEPANLNGDVNE